MKVYIKPLVQWQFHNEGPHHTHKITFTKGHSLAALSMEHD